MCYHFLTFDFVSGSNGGGILSLGKLYGSLDVTDIRLNEIFLLNITFVVCSLLEPLLWDYRKDFWWMPLTSLLQLGLRCAYLSGRPAEYFTYAVELCSRVTIKSLEEKTHVFDNLVGILQKRMPPSPPDSCDYSSATQLWADQFASLAKGACITTIVTNTISSFVEVKATFTQKQFAAEDVVELEVHVM